MKKIIQYFWLAVSLLTLFGKGSVCCQHMVISHAVSPYSFGYFYWAVMDIQIQCQGYGTQYILYLFMSLS